MVKIQKATLDSLLTAVSAYLPPDQNQLIRQAYEAVSTVGLSMAEHALPAAELLASLRLDAHAIAAALLLQPLIQEKFSLEDLHARFGEEISKLVDGIRRLYLMRWDRFDNEIVERMRKMFLAMAADIRVVIVSLALRVRDMRDVRSLPDSDRRQLARETLEIFAPLANRLGIFQLKWELEDLSLRELEPEIYRQIGQLLANKRNERARYIDEAISILKDRLKQENIPAKITGRPKHIYSIYKKMQRKQVGFTEIYDVSAIRILVERIQDCYAVLGIVHSLWTPIPGEFDDYIAKPKANGYQSLHTAVNGPAGTPLEVQIRTQDMHQLGEFGVAAHWRYKENRRNNRLIDEKFNFLRQLMDWQKEVTDPRDFVESLKTDIFQDQVYVFTPQGDVIDLPLGATPVDFAYRVHTNVGHRCRGALVNGQMIALDHKLKTGDRVEILTHKNPSPSRDWLNPQLGYVHSSSTRQKIRQWFRQQGRTDAITQGRELLDREFKRVGMDKTKYEEIASQCNFANPDDLFAAVGFGDTNSQTIVTKILDAQRANEELPIPEQPVPVKKPEPRKKSASGVSIDGITDILSHPARCCTPVPGDPVIGYILQGKGLSIHRRDCPNIVSHPEPERLLDIEWGQENQQNYPVSIAVHTLDRPGVLRDITSIMSDFGVNLQSIQAQTNKKDRSGIITAVLEVRNNEQVLRLLNKIARLPNVQKAYRQTA